MKVKGIIRESVEPDDRSVIVEFIGDPKKQHFEVHCTFDPFEKTVQKWDQWEFQIRWETEIFVEAKTGKKSYFTHLFCDEAKPVHQSGRNIERNWQDDRIEKDLGE